MRWSAAKSHHQTEPQCTGEYDEAAYPSLQAHLDSGATTLAWCWRLTRRDGLTLGFTDHDRKLAFDGTTFEAATGFTASGSERQPRPRRRQPRGRQRSASDRLAEDDLAAGHYDDARVEMFRVNWPDAAQRVLMRTGCIGEVRRTGTRLHRRGARPRPLPAAAARAASISAPAMPTSATGAAGSI